jgi:hypothetical protein
LAVLFNEFNKKNLNTKVTKEPKGKTFILLTVVYFISFMFNPFF